MSDESVTPSVTLSVVPVTVPYHENPCALNPIRHKPGRKGSLLNLTAEELRVTEVWIRTDGTKLQRANLTQQIMRKRYAITLSGQQILDTVKKPGSLQYRKRLRWRARNAALRTLRRQIPAVVEDLTWARDTARDVSDYKEVRQAAEGHLDRMGVTLKKDQAQVQVQAIILRGRNFDVADLDRPSPEIEVAEIVPEEDAESGV